MGISLNAEPNTGEDRDPILGPNFAEQELFTGNEISPTLDSLERCSEQVNGREKLSSDLQEKVLALYDEYRPRLFRYLRSMRLGRDAADEVIQETFMRLTMEMLKDGNIQNVPGWIVRVSHNLTVDLLKKLQEPVTTDESVAFVIENRVDTALSPEELYSKKEQSKRMKFALSTFKPLHRQCFQLRTQGFRYKDIALAVGISEQRAAFIVKQVAVRLAAVCG